MRGPRAKRNRKMIANGPFFTVLIPTMNRPVLLRAAIQTVMWQTFGDFELIVSDNSNDETSICQNRETISRFAADPRIHYIRPGQWMNMPDHWEFASRHASGHYVVILTDRHVMRPSALGFLHAQINHLGEDGKVISWHSRSAFTVSGNVDTHPFTGERKVLDSKQEICEYARCASWRVGSFFGNRLPRMLNSCYRSDVAHTVREKHGRLFMPISPDYTCAYLLLAYTDKFAYVDRPLFMCHGNQGNGQHGLVYGTSYRALSLDHVDPFAGTPMALNTATNSVLRDLLMVKALVGTRLSSVNVDLVGYFMCNYAELLTMEKLGSQADIRALYRQWWEGVHGLALEQRTRIEEYAAELNEQRAPFTVLRRLTVRFGLDPLYHSIIGAVRHVGHRLAGRPVYADVLAAAKQTDYILADTVEAAAEQNEGVECV